MRFDEITVGTVAVGVDGSPSSDHALRWAVEEATATGRALTLVHAVAPYAAVAPEAAQYAKIALEDSRKFLQGWMDKYVAWLRQHARM